MRKFDYLFFTVLSVNNFFALSTTGFTAPLHPLYLSLMQAVSPICVVKLDSATRSLLISSTFSFSPEYQL